MDQSSASTVADTSMNRHRASPAASRIAFAVVAHKAPEQVAGLISTLDLGPHVCVVHCDRKAGPRLGEEIRRLIPASIRDHVRFIQTRSVTWGGWGLIGATLDGMRVLLDWHDEWSHFVNLSGQCLPTRPVSELATFLARHPQANFVEWFDARTEFPRALRWSRFHYIDVGGYILFTPFPSYMPSRMRIHKGSNWVMLSRAFCQSAVGDAAVRAEIEAFKHAKLPEEMVFQTVLMNGPFRDTVINDSRRLIVWPKAGAPHPRILTMRDRERLDVPGPFIARKFDVAVDADVVRLLVSRAGGDPGIVPVAAQPASLSHG